MEQRSTLVGDGPPGAAESALAACEKWLEKRFSSAKLPRALAHYTSIGNAVNIVSSGKVWLFNARTLNDDQEIDHALGAIVSHRAISSLRLLETEAYLSLFRRQQGSVFVFCLSAQSEAKPTFDRLSMWRAYGDGGNGAAIYIRPESLRQAVVSNTRRPVVAPVLYTERDKNALIDELASVFAEITTGLHLPSATEAMLLSSIIWRLAPFMKHPAFEDELEWRIALEILRPGQGVSGSDLIAFHRDSRPYVEVPLTEAGAPHLDLQSYEVQTGGRIFDGAMIGPSPYQKANAAVISSALLKAEEYGSLLPVDLSQIPYRGRA